MILQVKTGTIDAKIWEITGGIEHFESLDFIKIEGQVTSFQNSLQLNTVVSAVFRKSSIMWLIICRPVFTVLEQCIKN